MSDQYLDLDEKLKDYGDEAYNQKWIQVENYKVVKKMNDPRFGEITILKHKGNGQVIFSKENNPTNTKKFATQEIDKCKARLLSNHSCKLEMIAYSMETKKGMCSTNYLSTCYYEFPKSDLFKELKARNAEGSKFSTNDLTHLSYQALSGLENLHDRDMIHGDIRPQNIGYDKKMNKYQLLDYLKDPNTLEKKQINNLSDEREIFMSPQLYSKIEGKDKKQKIDGKKNDLFSLGMTLLSLGNNKTVKDCYNEDGKINQANLDNHLRDFKRKNVSNPYLNQVTENLLEYDQDKRKPANQILAKLPGYIEFKQMEKTGNLPETNFGFQKTNRVLNSTPGNLPGSNQIKLLPLPTGGKDTKVQSSPYSNYIPQQKIIESKPIYTTYNQPQKTYVQSTPQTYVQSTPQTYVQSTPQKTYVQSTPQYVQSSPQYIQPTPQNYIHTQPQNNYVVVQPEPTQVRNENFKSMTFVNVNQNENTHINAQHMPVLQTTNTVNNQVYQQPTNQFHQQTQQVYTPAPDVEVRRGSYIPPPSLEKKTTVVKKKYVMKDGKVVEVEVKEDEVEEFKVDYVKEEEVKVDDVKEEEKVEIKTE